MKKLKTLLILSTLTAGAASVYAASHAGAPTATDAKKDSAAATASADMAEGEVRKVDKDTKKITIKHGVIKSMDMPAMTMVFQVKDAALLDKVKAGDKIRFSAGQTSGAIVVTEIQAK
ncbi:MAG TPA: copper-binding protein [Polaromonas sp.]|uniref:copper-binding protein n=1 Tax=Polaromonas sp. TaxID=1869339 RepID=UPI002D2D3665|nr:copper-binding protein [Polaromonas sp.]HYW56626.1 copper-binding protein [Polaromonas sp.]